MDLPIIVYGDSFSNPQSCQSQPQEMWFRSAWPNSTVVFNRARPGNSPQSMFLEATHDAVTRTDPTRLVVALGPLFRLPRYEDGWFDQERLTDNRPEDGDPAQLADACELLKAVHHHDLQELDAKTALHLTDMLHPTLLWSLLFQNVINLDALCGQRGHELVVLHMNHRPDINFRDRHVLVEPLWRAARETGSYWHTDHSCAQVCEQAGILPWDHDQYGMDGHHGPQGQRHFGSHMHDLIP